MAENIKPFILGVGQSVGAGLVMTRRITRHANDTEIIVGECGCKTRPYGI